MSLLQRNQLFTIFRNADFKRCVSDPLASCICYSGIGLFLHLGILSSHEPGQHSLRCRNNGLETPDEDLGSFQPFKATLNTAMSGYYEKIKRQVLAMT